jgi:nucleoside-diphosphate kinase
MSSGAVLGFECEWFDGISGELNTLFIKYFLDDNTIEILTPTRTFLARIYYPDVTVVDLFLGNSITVYNRMITIKKYCNKATSEYMESREVHFLVVVGGEGRQHLGRVLQLSKEHRLITGKMRTTGVDMPDIGARAGDFLIQAVGYDGAESHKYIPAVESIGPSVTCVALSSDDMISTMAVKSATLCPDSDDCTLCIIKPHILREQKCGEVIDAILSQGYEISAMYSAHLTNSIAEELLDVYKEIFPKFTAMIEHLTSSPCLALKVTAGKARPGFGLVESFREHCGPLNPELARTLRKNSLRARFGESYECNAVHCTDLAEDAHMECRYFFETLAKL